uniref:Beta-1,4-N-acetylgalactosaminyltransferase n=2 Tax=Wuchereria bancrofti TaxID=6293 RepID=A0AAF5RW29_WUCBA
MKMIQDESKAQTMTSTSILRQKFLKLLLSSVNHQTTLSHFIRHRFKKPFKIDQFKQKHYISASNFCPTFDEITDFSGPLSMGPLLIKNLKEQEVAQIHSYIKSGGHWKPRNCLARHKIAIIIPFRDRQSQLTRLLDFLFPILKHQNLDFRFIITEQYGNELFNKGKLMNAAFSFAEKLRVNCVIFHDVDMFPADDRINYGCPDTPRHIGAYVNTLGYRLMYAEIVGGVLAIRMNHFHAVNGFSNEFWGWGGEDDDMGIRILTLNMTIERPDALIGRYIMLRHIKRKDSNNQLIRRMLKASHIRMQWDGVKKLTWTILQIIERPLYYHLYVDVGRPPPGWH